MKRLFCFCLCVLLPLIGCAPREVRLFSCFREGFAAECSGECNGVGFAALFEAQELTEEGVLPLTVTFYAPDALAGTVLSRDAAGEITLALDGMRVQDGVAGFLPLLEIFPVSDEITAITVSDTGHTMVEGGGGSVELLADGTPAMLCRGAVRVQVIRWESR